MVIVTDYANFPTDYANFYTNNIKYVTIYSRNQNQGKEVKLMGKKLGRAVAKAVEFSAKMACNSTSMIGCYQPVAPKQMKPVKKSEKK